MGNAAFEMLYFMDQYRKKSIVIHGLIDIGVVFFAMNQARKDLLYFVGNESVFVLLRERVVIRYRSQSIHRFGRAQRGNVLFDTVIGLGDKIG